MKRFALGLAAALACLSAHAEESFTGQASLEYKFFMREPADPTLFSLDRIFQHGKETSSIALQFEYLNEWDNGRSFIRIVPFYRIDEHDENRTHADLREAIFYTSWDNWDLRIGVGKVYWGVAESLHLVDIINQTDFVESLDGEEKLGQPMIATAWRNGWGTFELFALIGHRERTFPGRDGRLRPSPAVSRDAEYESRAGDNRLDGAFRWSQSFGDWDIGLSHFSGTSRDPRLELEAPVFQFPFARLVPHYDVIDQTSLDVQGIVFEDTLVKLEVTSTTGVEGEDRYERAVGGFEHTLYQIFDTDIDLGLIAEYQWDSRGDDVTTHFSEDDVFVGGRMAFNDDAGTEILGGAIQDVDQTTRLYSIEASRRIGNDWRIYLEGRWFSNIDDNEVLLQQLDREDYIQIEVTRFF